jgi:hypothetical protein
VSDGAEDEASNIRYDDRAKQTRDILSHKLDAGKSVRERHPNRFSRVLPQESPPLEVSTPCPNGLEQGSVDAHSGPEQKDTNILAIARDNSYVERAHGL